MSGAASAGNGAFPHPRDHGHGGNRDGVGVEHFDLNRDVGGGHDLAIDHYLAMNMDAVVEFNDAIGGVTVTVTDDFSKVDPTIPVGAVRL